MRQLSTPLRRLSRQPIQHCTRSLQTAAGGSKGKVRIVEVGPRDGLQNEKTPISAEDKVTLINKLTHAGLEIVEAGSFVSPKWVPQMAGTTDVLKGIDRWNPSVHYPVLVPNEKGLQNLITLLSSHPDGKTLTDEIAVFVAASESFSKANINCTIQESLQRLVPVIKLAEEKGLRVRGYVSTVIECPYEGKISGEKVRDVAKELKELGCYEISLGDTVGKGDPLSVKRMLEVVQSAVPVAMLAAHMHDTYGLGVANSIAAVQMGVRTVDSSVAGLGGCPFSPGATGNVATEDIVYALHAMGYSTGINMDALVEVGDWISKRLGRANASRVGPAVLAARARKAARST